jgi:hypothetical protein
MVVIVRQGDRGPNVGHFWVARVRDGASIGAMPRLRAASLSCDFCYRKWPIRAGFARVSGDEPVRRRTGCPSVLLSPDFWLLPLGDAGLKAADIEQDDRIRDSGPDAQFELLAQVAAEIGQKTLVTLAGN